MQINYLHKNIYKLSNYTCLKKNMNFIEKGLKILSENGKELKKKAVMILLQLNFQGSHGQHIFATKQIS